MSTNGSCVVVLVYISYFVCISARVVELPSARTYFKDNKDNIFTVS